MQRGDARLGFVVVGGRGLGAGARGRDVQEIEQAPMVLRGSESDGRSRRGLGRCERREKRKEGGAWEQGLHKPASDDNTRFRD